ncbi:MAG: hypothetical protein A2Y57_04930 [Candidatus Woykebacteria bacterium RBG_13_40_7b]|uniref:Endolytic murein transglycosylase n=1 Tax=Candidatus Woykebacteria bacterium RBG_13_40_7b TaxID=1802594 RepID=A0A1G1W6U0_9BACT|nr:MAG: hypothetical protein A2Y57_04930 [Candidatus Woykebacteria bacterium RBG_13_40_7b]
MIKLIVRILLPLIFLILIFSGFAYFNFSLSAVGGSQEKNFIVERGQGASEIANNLKEQGLIKDSLVFKILIRLSSIGNQLKAGSYKLSTNYDARKILDVLREGKNEFKLTIVEGLRVEEIAQILEEKLSISKKDFLKVAREGYMFPDTYFFPTRVNAPEVAKAMMENFEEKFSSSLQQKAKESDFSTDEVIILASIIEREGKEEAERKIISGILYKRLEEGIALSTDATIQYALGYQKEEDSWWKKTLIQDDLNLDSPYNTRKYPGLPPAPICNPSLVSLIAALEPQSSEFFFYIHDKEGEAHFARTLEEQEENINRYLL